MRRETLLDNDPERQYNFHDNCEIYHLASEMNLPRLVSWIQLPSATGCWKNT